MSIAIDDYREDEIQALIVLAELSDPIETPNNNFYHFYPKTLEEAQTYFRSFAAELGGAFPTLAERGLVEADEEGKWTLTEEGHRVANQMRALRPPIYYWYRDFYTAIENSAAFDRYATRVYGMNLGQHGFSDMAQLNQALDELKLDATCRVLDLGCGNGKIAEYISDQTGASVVGVDYVPEAIAQALERTADKRNRLDFYIGNIVTLDFDLGLFDVILSIDTIFFGVDLQTTIAGLARMLNPHGRMAIFYGGDDLGPALKANGLTYVAHDLCRPDYEHKQLKYRVASEMREDFEREGNLFIWENQMAESIKDPSPYDPAKATQCRYLYLASA